MRSILILLAVIVAVAAVGLIPTAKIYDEGLWPLSVSIRFMNQPWWRTGVVRD
jgi:hypothetical protein